MLLNGIIANLGDFIDSTGLARIHVHIGCDITNR
jgi:hypothetical protein